MREGSRRLKVDTTRRRLFVFFVVYLIFVIYGSLVPLAFNAMPFDSAWQRFLSIPWLDLGPGSRADWVANILLYIPLSGALFAVILRSGTSSFFVATVGTFVFCTILALTVEFLQVYFPPRTVSLNDLLAEVIGATIGIAVAAFLVTRRWPVRTVYDPPHADYLLAAYGIGYLALSFFPFDFIVSPGELQAKLHSGTAGFITAAAGCTRLYLCGTRLLVEALLTVPIGILIAATHRKKRSGSHLLILWGLAFGVGVELLQIVLLSGISQGVSALSKAAGFALGMGLHARAGEILERLRRVNPRPLINLLAFPYVFGLMVANGWLFAQWLGWGDAMDKLDGLRFLPFYYHYFTTETAAMVSLLFVAGLYGPLGIAVAFLQKNARSAKTAPTVFLAGLVAVCFEIAKLFQVGERPDPTNALIAIGAAVVVQLFVFRLLSILFWRYTSPPRLDTTGREMTT
jgi:VanZ family protein